MPMSTLVNSDMENANEDVENCNDDPAADFYYGLYGLAGGVDDRGIDSVGDANTSKSRPVTMIQQVHCAKVMASAAASVSACGADTAGWTTTTSPTVAMDTDEDTVKVIDDDSPSKVLPL